MSEYVVDLTVMQRGFSKSHARTLVAAFDRNSNIIEGSTIIGGGPDRVGISYNIEATDARQAVDCGLRLICEVLDCKDIDKVGEVSELHVEQYIDSAQRDLVTKAEVARRLSLSKTRVRELAARAGFPQPRQITRNGYELYHWGEVKTWNDGRLKDKGKHRSKGQELSDGQKIAV